MCETGVPPESAAVALLKNAYTFNDDSSETPDHVVVATTVAEPVATPCETSANVTSPGLATTVNESPTVS